ncbi:MAG: hypothetical protein R2873_15850 [Caldilineaceae bacterium]
MTGQLLRVGCGDGADVGDDLAAPVVLIDDGFDRRGVHRVSSAALRRCRGHEEAVYAAPAGDPQDGGRCRG